MSSELSQSHDGYPFPDLWQIMMPGENLLKYTFHCKCEYSLAFLAFVLVSLSFCGYEVNPYIITFILPIIIIRFSVFRYKQAAFCYEELILAQPMIPLHHLAYADVSIYYKRVLNLYLENRFCSCSYNH